MALTDNILSWYKMNDNAASTAVSDSTNNCPGTAAQNTNLISTPDATPAIDRALSFNGTSDSISQAGSNALANEWTVAGFFKLNDAGADASRQVLVNWKPGSGDVNRIEFEIVGGVQAPLLQGHIMARITSSTGSVGGVKTYSGNTLTVDATWYHIAETWDGTNLKLYINAVEDTPYTIQDNTAVTMTSSVRNKRLGRNTGGATFYFNGIMDLVGFWSRTLSQSEISQLYNSGSGLLLSFTDVADLESKGNIRPHLPKDLRSRGNIRPHLSKDLRTKGGIKYPDIPRGLQTKGNVIDSKVLRYESGQYNGSSTLFTHTCGGAYPGLVVFTRASYTFPWLGVTSVTCNGVAMHQGPASGQSSVGINQSWYYESPIVGDNTITIIGGGGIQSFSFSFAGANQDDLVGFAYAETSSTSGSYSKVCATESNDSILVDSIDSDIAAMPSPGVNQIARINDGVSHNTSTQNTTTAGNYTMDWTLGFSFFDYNVLEVKEFVLTKIKSLQSKASIIPTPVVAVLLIAAGGGGGKGDQASQAGGGGGGGGYVYDASRSVIPSTIYPVTVGLGSAGIEGGNSIFDSLIAIGGGRGGSYASGPGTDGGSGGGGCSNHGGLGTQGYDGGDGLSSYAGAGGGGAGAIGQDTQGSAHGGDGGIGIVNPIVGSTSGENIGGIYYLAGGGGGGANSGSYGIGGDGGGADGAQGGLNNGLANTGGGGGGRYYIGGMASGGSGVVVITYPTGSLIGALGGTITTVGGMTIHTFNASGTFSFQLGWKDLRTKAEIISSGAIRRQKDLESKAKLFPQQKKDLESKANVFHNWKDLRTKGNIKPPILKDLESKGNIKTTNRKDLETKGRIKHTYPNDLRTEGNLWKTTTTYKDLRSKGSIKKTNRKDLESRGSISGSIKKDLRTKGNILFLGIAKTILVSPLNTSTTNSPITFVWEIPADSYNRNIVSHIQIDQTSAAFGNIEAEKVSSIDAGFQYWDGASWVAYPAAGVGPIYYGNQARILIPLTLGLKYWRVRGEA